MIDLARAHILACGDFLQVQDLARCLGVHVELLSSAIKEWEADQRIFSIDHDGCSSFPVYAFPPQGGASPIPALRDVLSIFRPMKDGWGVSFWFISPNGWLGGKPFPRTSNMHLGQVEDSVVDEDRPVTPSCWGYCPATIFTSPTGF